MTVKKTMSKGKTLTMDDTTNNLVQKYQILIYLGWQIQPVTYPTHAAPLQRVEQRQTRELFPSKRNDD